jgi:hypothetical protein
MLTLRERGGHVASGRVGRRRKIIVPIECYTLERKAEFILSNATTAEEYREARKSVKKLGLNPDLIVHRHPG